MPKDILPKVTFCPKTSCPIWQFVYEDILPKDFLPKLTICPKRTNCPWRHFAHNLEGFCPSIFVLLILIYEGFLPIHFTKMGKKKLIYCSDLNLSYICLTRIKKKFLPFYFEFDRNKELRYYSSVTLWICMFQKCSWI